MRIKPLLTSLLVVATTLTVQAEKPKAPIPPLRGADEQPVNNNVNTLDPDALKNLKNLEYLTLDSNQIKNLPENIFQNLSQLEQLALSSDSFKFEQAEKFSQKVPLFGYVRVKNFQKLDSELTAAFRKDAARHWLLPPLQQISQPVTIFSWDNPLSMQLAMVFSVGLDEPFLKNWVNRLHKNGYPQTQPMQFWNNPPRTLVTFNSQGRDRIQESGTAFEALSQMPMVWDIEAFLNTKMMGSRKDTFVQFMPSFLPMLFAQTSNPIKRGIPDPLLKEEPATAAFIGANLLDKEAVVSVTLQRKEPDPHVQEAIQLPSLVHFLPEATLRFEWKTTDPEESFYNMFPLLSKMEEQVLLRPLIHILAEVQHHSKTVVVAGSIQAENLSSKFGPNRLLVIRLENAKAAETYLAALQKEAKWTNDGRLHEARAKDGMDLHISIRPACRKVEGFDVDCYYARITEKVPSKKKRKIVERPYTYQAVRVGSHVLISWDQEKPETTTKLNELVKTFLSGSAEHPLKAIQQMPAGGDFYMDLKINELKPPWKALISEKDSFVTVANYPSEKFIRQEIHVPRAILSAARLLK